MGGIAGGLSPDKLLGQLPGLGGGLPGAPGAQQPGGNGNPAQAMENQFGMPGAPQPGQKSPWLNMPLGQSLGGGGGFFRMPGL